MSLNSDKLRKTYQNLSLVALLEICDSENSGYAPEAKELAEEELSSRMVSEADLAEARTILQQEKLKIDPKGDLSDKAIRGIDSVLSLFNPFKWEADERMLIFTNLFWFFHIVLNYRFYSFFFYQIFTDPSFLFTEGTYAAIYLTSILAILYFQRKRYFVIWVLQNCLLSYLFIRELIDCIWVNQQDTNTLLSNDNALQQLLNILVEPQNEGYFHYLTLILCYGIALFYINRSSFRLLYRIPMWVSILSGLTIFATYSLYFLQKLLYLDYFN